MAVLKPFFQYYGSKWRAALLYPAPEYATIVEPFAGGASYALRYPDHKVHLLEKSPVVAGIWDYLVNVSASEILALPDVPAGATIRDLPIPPEAQNLIGFWLETGVSHPRPRPCKRMRGPNLSKVLFWGPRVRERIARQLDAIRHWRVYLCAYEDVPSPQLRATWFVDPPYQEAGRHYRHGSDKIDFAHLGQWCRDLQGQVIVCENDGANWLPFRYLASTQANIRGTPKKRSAEAIWTSCAPAHGVSL